MKLTLCDSHKVLSTHYNLRYVSFLIMMFFSLLSTYSQHSETFTIAFKEEDFSFCIGQDKMLRIESKIPVSYPTSGGPCLPWIDLNFVINSNQEYYSSSYSLNTHLISKDIVLEDAPLSLPTNEVNNLSTATPSYPLTIFPSSSCKYATMSNWNEISVIHFLSSPFIYNAVKKELYFIDQLELTVTFSEAQIKDNTRPMNESERLILKKKVHNPEKLNKTVTSPVVYSVGNPEKINYLIITSESLKDSYVPLLNWKNKKGLKSKIITIEEIQKTCQGEDIQLKIKNLLCNLYYSNTLKYVLLGGDDSIVPVRGCYGEAPSKDVNNPYVDYTIPTDLYYACFSGDFSWDANNNKIYGELGDNVNLIPQIAIGRLPVRTPEQVSIYVDRILSYETHPQWSNNILMGGVKLYYSENNHSDAEICGDILFNNYIRPFWTGNRFNFYDTHTDFPSDSNHNVTANHLMECIGGNYSMIDFNTHGNQTSWSMETGSNYSIHLANQQHNNVHSFITTGACLTNAFDNSAEGGFSDPCLSEGLIRNPNSGVIGYLGSSRYGWSYEVPGYGLGPSLQYEAYFYEYLFNPDILDKSIGNIVNLAKTSMIPKLSNEYDSYRWLMFSLNQIGDPEIRLYTDEPKIFNHVIVNDANGEFSIDTGIDGTNICIISSADEGESFYQFYPSTRQLSLNTLPEQCNICITKYGYIPYQASFTMIQNKIITGQKEYNSDIIKIGSNVTSTEEKGPVIITEADVVFKGKKIILDKGTKIEKGSKVSIMN